MTALVALIAPQRSTQYAATATALAAPELLLSPLGPDILALEPVQLGGRAFLKLELSRTPDEQALRELGTLAMSSAFFEYYERVGDQPGAFLRRLDTRFDPLLPPDLPMTRLRFDRMWPDASHLLAVARPRRRGGVSPLRLRRG